MTSPNHIFNIFTIYFSKTQVNQGTLNFGDEGLSLRGDLLIKCFLKPSEKNPNAALDDRQLLFQCQFNTCALELDPRQPQLTFHRAELDLVGK